MAFFLDMRLPLIICIVIIFAGSSVCQTSIKRLASRIVESGQSEADRLERVYSWVTKHIAYDESLSVNDDNTTFADMQRPLEVLRSRKAVCQGYANLTHALLKELQIESFVVNGFSRNDLRENLEAHAWNAVKLNNHWYLVDATWDAGYLEDGVYIKKSNKDFYLNDPKSFIKTHWPNDPIWQLLPQPTSRDDFENQTIVQVDNPTHNYQDTLKQFIQMDEIKREFSSAYRKIRFDEYNYSGHYDLAIAYFKKANNLGEQYHSATENLHYVDNWIKVSPTLLTLLDDQRVALDKSLDFFEYLKIEAAEFRNTAVQNINIIKQTFKNIDYEINMINKMRND